MRRWACVVWVCVTGCLLAVPSVAGASAYTEVYGYFAQHATVPNCMFSAATLLQARSSGSSNDGQYDAGFPAAINSALQAQVGGACSHGASRSVPIPGVAGLSSGRAGRLPGSSTDATSSGVPLAIVLVALLALLLAGGAAIYGVARRAGSESLALADWRHACAEAGLRISDRWADLTDRRSR